MNKINALELWMLKRFCDQHELDYQEIDDTLTYYEVKEHLMSIAIGPLYPETNMAAWESQMEEFMKKHILEYYIVAALAGETRSTEVGKPYYPRFSLTNFIQTRK